MLGLVALYVVHPLVMRWTVEHQRGATVAVIAIACLFALDNAAQFLGLWAPVKDALIPYGIRHW